MRIDRLPRQIKKGLAKAFPLAACSATLISTVALAQGDSAGASNDDIARALAHPNSTLGSLNFPIDYVRYKGDLPGADSQDSWRIGFQPVLPYALNETTNLFVRPNIPILINQPVPLVGGGDFTPSDGGAFGSQTGIFGSSGTELGDIGFDIAVGKTLPSQMVVAAGVVGALDTATDEAVGLGQYLLGPELAVAQITDWGVLGVLVTHQWDVAGDDDFDTSITGGQYYRRPVFLHR